MRRILDDAQLDEMAELRERGWSTARIAEHFTSAGTPITGATIYWQCLRVGADVPPRFRRPGKPPEKPYRRGAHIVRPYSADEDAKLRAWSIEGIKTTEIARRIGRKHNSVLGRLLTLAREEARQEDDQ